ncbi:MAG: NAD(P)/FAD-dependent oxidoreductase [Rhizobiaceae bacterium]
MPVTVQRFPSNPGPAAWDCLLPPRKPQPVLNDSKTADFAVIGAGFAGLSAARRLLQLNPGSKIVVLEAQTVANGPAGRNSGFMIDLPHNLGSTNYAGDDTLDQLRTNLNREAISFAQEAALEYKMGNEAFAPSGKINSAATAKGVLKNRAYAQHLTRLNEDHEMLDQQQMKDVCGSDYYLQGLYTPGTVLIQPALYVRHLADGLVNQGVDLFENTPVTAFAKTTSGWDIKVPGATLSAGTMVLTVNGHVESFGFFKRRLMHIYLYASMTRAMSVEEAKQLGGYQNWAFTPSDPLGTTVRKISGTGGTRIIVRNRFTWAPDRHVSDARLASIAPAQDRSFRNRFPSLDGLPMEYRWGGLLCLSRNSSPAFGELDTNLYSACCQNGLGTVAGTLSGKLAAEIASGIANSSTRAMQDLPLPEKLPPEPFSSLGANAYMRWAEFNAGREL